jgi:hypothetical protein
MDTVLAGIGDAIGQAFQPLAEVEALVRAAAIA